jgi:hypothetical protein
VEGRGVGSGEEGTDQTVVPTEGTQHTMMRWCAR